MVVSTHGRPVVVLAYLTVVSGWREVGDGGVVVVGQALRRRWGGVGLQAQVQSMQEWLKEHESYNSDLQEVEKWLLQMSSRLVTSDSMQTSSMEMATQQLARHKVTATTWAHKGTMSRG